jgi:hypothetical protein
MRSILAEFADRSDGFGQRSADILDGTDFARSLVVLVSNFLLLVLSPPRRTVLVLSETVLVLDGCLNCGDADRGSGRFAVTCGPKDPWTELLC